MQQSRDSNSSAIVVKGYSDFFSSWDWEWKCDLTFNGNEIHPEDRARKYLLDWTRWLCTTEHLQVGYFYALVYKDKLPHLHLLMLGRGKAAGGEKTLMDVPPNPWARAWPFFARIEYPRSNEGVSHYLGIQQRPSKSDRFDFDTYNKKLLLKLKKRL